MRGRARSIWLALGALLLAGAGSPALDYRVDEGRNINAFVREGKVAAHVVLRSGSEPRLLVAFPAGNSGVGLWFEPTEEPIRWSLANPPRPVTLADAAGRPLNGITFEVAANAPALVMRQGLLSSVRVLRDYEGQGSAPAEVVARPVVEGNRIGWSRDRLDGEAGYRLSVELLDGSIEDGHLTAGEDGLIRLRVTAATGEPPLMPLAGDALLNDTANADPAARDALEFLAYREKLLAGSWRFNTYFGRDTLMSVRLLMPALQPEAVEAGLRSVLARLSLGGEVAHEEDIGEFAVLRHMREDGVASAEPIYDYKMVDDDFMLAPVAAAWLLDDPRGAERAATFLEAVGNGEALARNLLWVVERAAPFAAEPVAANLVGLKPGVGVGQWRDSDAGLAGGRYPYDVNAVLVPAALEAAARLLDSGLLDAWLGAEERLLLARAGGMADRWQANAPPLFAVTVPAPQVRAAIAAYAEAIGVPPQAPGDGPVRFPALALDAAGRPIPILHSDVGFAMLFGDPPSAALDRAVAAIMRRFPAGLMTDAGLLVANPVFAGGAARASLDRNAYHGTVVWSWQQALLAAGLERQLGRADLPPPVRARLDDARSRLWETIAAAKAVRSSELWSWAWTDGRFIVAPFGASAADEDESNAAQLWSTVYLALEPPSKEERQ